MAGAGAASSPSAARAAAALLFMEALPPLPARDDDELTPHERAPLPPPRVTRPPCPQCGGNQVKTLGGGIQGKHRYSCEHCSASWQQAPPHRLLLANGNDASAPTGKRSPPASLPSAEATEERPEPNTSRGRPRTVDTSESDQRKKPRGRPRKDKSECDQPKRPRGRPRKEKSECDLPKRPRGRPRKDKSESHQSVWGLLDEEVEREIAACHHLADSSVPPDASLGTRRWTLWKENNADKYKEWQEMNKEKKREAKDQWEEHKYKEWQEMNREKRREAKDQWEEQNQGEKVKHSFFVQYLPQCRTATFATCQQLPRVHNVILGVDAPEEQVGAGQPGEAAGHLGAAAGAPAGSGVQGEGECAAAGAQERSGVQGEGECAAAGAPAGAPAGGSGVQGEGECAAAGAPERSGGQGEDECAAASLPGAQTPGRGGRVLGSGAVA